MLNKNWEERLSEFSLLFLSYRHLLWWCTLYEFVIHFFSWFIGDYTGWTNNAACVHNLVLNSKSNSCFFGSLVRYTTYKQVSDKNEKFPTKRTMACIIDTFPRLNSTPFTFTSSTLRFLLNLPINLIQKRSLKTIQKVINETNYHIYHSLVYT